MRALLAVLFLLPALAGCLATPEDVAPQSDDAMARPSLADALAALEAGEPSANIHLLGALADGGSAEIDAWGDFLFVMKSGTVRIVNASDPANLVEVSVIQPAHRVLDVKVSDDGRYLFVGDDDRAAQTPAHGAIATTPGARKGGIYVYDVTDKTAPAFVSYQPVGPERGPHMVAYHRMPDGRELIMGANADVSLHLFDRESGTLTEVARFRPNLVTAFNRDPEVFDVLYQGWAHDMFAMSEADGTTLMYVANWDAGLRVVDVTDPATPKELGAWNAFPKGHEGNLHTVATAWVGERRITVGAVEVGFAVVGGYHYAQGTDASIMYVWDTTDATNVKLLGFWENPNGEKSGRDYVPGETLSSTHNLQIEDGRVYLAHYGLGVWVLDVSTAETQAAPAVLGYYDAPEMNTWDVIVLKGVMFTSGAEGLLSLHFATDVVGDLGITSRA